MSRPGQQLRQLAAKATPGPWEMSVDETPPEWVSVRDKDGRWLLFTDGGIIATERANATLAALAPDLAVLVADLADALAFIREGGYYVGRLDALLARVRELEARIEGGAG